LNPEPPSKVRLGRQWKSDPYTWTYFLDDQDSVLAALFLLMQFSPKEIQNTKMI
jgi:hypothetical protein